MFLFSEICETFGFIRRVEHRKECWFTEITGNLSLDSNSEAGKYATSIMAFPTTIVLDRNGNIIGEPIMGGIDNDEAYKQLMKTIDQILAADKN